MNALHDWFDRWHIPAAARADLHMALGLACAAPAAAGSAVLEAGIQSQLRLAASKAGIRAWRNNVGAGYDEDGRFMRWGLANDSAQLNKVLKSSDLIGAKPVVITSQMVGSTLGQFWAREVKRATWRYTGTEREVAQLNFITLVQTLGGDARFATSPDHV